jgi:GNAT superfamily N-acetyltransferase
MRDDPAVLVTHVVTYLEMTARDQLHPAMPAPLELRPETDVALIRPLHDRIAFPHGWSGLQWSDDRWREELARPHFGYWAVYLEDEAVGLLALDAPRDGNNEIDIFGLVPERVGQGLGGHFLSLGVRLAWDHGAMRVWLHTSSRDHPNAIHNYERRGFRPYRTESRQREV